MIRAALSRRSARWILPAAAVLVTVLAMRFGATPVNAGASLRLTDGRVLEGLDVRKEGDVYLLTIEGGAVVPVPMALVAEVGVAAEPAAPAPPQAGPGLTYAEPGNLAGGTGTPAGLTPGEARNLAGGPGAPAGLTYGEARTLAGSEVPTPTAAEQTAVFGEPSRFQANIVTSGFAPTYWVPDPSQHNFNPSKWAQAPTDPTWEPTSAFDPDVDVLAEGKSTFQTAPTDSTWVPQDGFQKKSAW